MKPSQASDPTPTVLQLSTGPASLADVGSGPTVVAIHGAPGSLSDWRWLAPCVEPHLRFIRLDLPGFGGTPLYVQPSPLPTPRARWVVEVLDALGVERFIPLGHSIGGRLALELAAQHPQRVPGVAVLCSLGLRKHQALKAHPWLQFMTYPFQIPLLKGPMTSLVRRGLEGAGFPHGLDDDAVMQTLALAGSIDFADQQQRVQRLTQPCFVAWSCDDRLVNPEIGEELGAACPDGPRLTFANGGHNIQKTQAVELGTALVEWVQSLT